MSSPFNAAALVRTLASPRSHHAAAPDHVPQWRPLKAAVLITIGVLLNVVGVFFTYELVLSRASASDLIVHDFEQGDKLAPPPAGGIVFVGSSSIARWDLPHYFPELGSRAINRGINSSYLVDTVRYADRLVVPYAPRTVIVYAGDNDIELGVSAQQLARMFSRFEAHVHELLPQARIVFISIKPSILRWSSYATIHSANMLIRDYCAERSYLRYVDIETPMLGANGMPLANLLQPDGIHLTDAGYRVWTDALRMALD